MLKYLPNVVTLQLDADACVGCEMCTIVCPHAVFIVEQGKARILDADACMECGACASNCPAEAIRVEAGVGCANAVISSFFGAKSDCCSEEPDCCDGKSDCCG